MDSEYFSTFIQTRDGGYLLGGTSWSGMNGDKTEPNWSTSSDFWVVKIDSIGNKQWDKRFGGTDYDGLSTLEQTSDGGYILGGTSQSDSSGDKTQASRGNDDYWIVKIDSVGNKLWDRRFGGVIFDRLNSLQQTTDGGYILGGASNSGVNGDKSQPTWDTVNINGNTRADFWVVKIDSLGNKLWDKRFGGIKSETIQSLQLTIDGGYILGGYSNSNISGDKTQPNWDTSFGNYPTTDFWVVKIDSVGNKQWDKRFGGTGDEQITSLLKTDDGGFILGGSSNSELNGDKTQSSLGDYDYWIVKINSLGNKQWDKRYGGNNRELYFGSITHASNGEYLLAGSSKSPLNGDKSENNLGDYQSWIVKIDSLGNKIWDKTIFCGGSNNSVGYAIKTNDGCYTVASYTNADIGGYKSQVNWDTSYGHKTSDYWIAKFCECASSALCLCFPINIDSIESLITADVDEINTYSVDSFFNHTYEWNVSNGIIISGQSTNSAEVDWDSAGQGVIQVIISQQGCLDTISKTVTIIDATGIQESSLNNITLHPNPTNNTLTITATINEQATLTLVDALGKEVWQQTFFADALKAGVQLSLKEQEQGIYFLSIRTAQGAKVMKVVKY